MAGKFPGTSIRYTEAAPSGEGAGATISVDASTGAEYIAMGMEALGQSFLKVAAAKRSIDFSTKKRQIEETSFAAVNIHKTTGDPKARQALEEQWSKDIDAITSNDPILNKELIKYKNDVLPSWGKTFANQNLAWQARQNKDAFEINLLRLKEAGAVEEARKQVWNYQKTTNQISEAEAAQMDKDMPVESDLAQSRILIASNPLLAIQKLTALQNLTGKQLDRKDELLRMANQQALINTDSIQNEITFGMFDNRNKTLAEKEALGRQYINKLSSTPGISAEAARVMTSRIENWMTGKEKVNDPLVSTKLFREITQLHRGIGKSEEVRRSIVAESGKIDDDHFESLNKYLDETVEEWNADTLRRLEKEAIPHLAPRLSMLERFIEMSAMPGISVADKVKYDSLIDRLREPAKVDANRLALYLNQCRKWIGANPTAPNFYENGRAIMATFERYTDEEIRRMEKQLESEATLPSVSTIGKTWKYTAINPKTGQRIGSDDQITWMPIP